jgi:predicted acylesterase/phospholipase RssA
MTWSDVGRAARVGYVLRFPLLTLLVLVAFGPVACLTSAAPMLGALFDLDGSWLALLSVDFVAVLMAMAAVTAVNLVLWHGTERLGDPAIVLHPHRRSRLILITGMACALAPMYFAGAHTMLGVSAAAGVLLKVAAALAGYLASAALAFLAHYLQLLLTDPAVTTQQPPFLLFPAGRFAALNAVYMRAPKLLAAKKAFAWLGRSCWTLLKPAGQGYLIPGRTPPKLYSGHVFVIWLALLSLAVYVGIGELKSRHMGHAQLFGVPSLTYVLLFLTVLCWGFSLLAFFFDRYRVPVLLTFLLLTQLTSHAPQSDHFYRVVPGDPALSRVTPGELLRRRITAGKRPILVATAGGGIQAAAWTTRVLLGLAQRCHCDLTQSVVLVSGVSGGSVGALYFGANAHDLQKAADSAAESSLDEVAWGWINPDVRRAVFPWSRNRVVDRGWALERTWEERAPAARLPLSQWARQAASPDPPFPAFLFNATVVEKGQPLVFATSAFTSESSFHSTYPGYDVRVATAVRLSASFPYVAPTARSDARPVNQPDYHVVDGGYYDNFGLLSLMEWLDEALSDASTSGLHRGIGILEIRSFPPAGEPAGSVHGWGFQTNAPLTAFLNVRSSAQLTLAQKQLELFKQKWSGSADIEAQSIEFPQMPGACGTPPLSWKLTAAQRKCIEDGWNSPQLQTTIDKVAGWFR